MVGRPPPAPNIRPMHFSFNRRLPSNLPKLTMDKLNKCKNEHEKKRLLGERLYPKICELEKNPNQITAMILGMQCDEIFTLLNNDTQLKSTIVKAKVEIGKKILNSQQQQQQQQQALKQIHSQVQRMKQQYTQAIKQLVPQQNEDNSTVDPRSGSTEY